MDPSLAINIHKCSRNQQHSIYDSLEQVEEYVQIREWTDANNLLWSEMGIPTEKFQVRIHAGVCLCTYERMEVKEDGTWQNQKQYMLFTSRQY